MVTELCDVSPCGSDWELVEPQSCSFSKKRAHCGTDTQGEMRYEGSPVKALPLSRRRMTPPTPMQNSNTSCVRDHGRYVEEGRGWNARERTIIARTKQFLERSFSVKVQFEALEPLLCPEDVDVDLTRILKEARYEQGRRNFETFCSNDMSFLVADWSRWDNLQKNTMETRFVGLCKRWMVASKLRTVSGTEDRRVGAKLKKGVIDAVEDYSGSQGKSSAVPQQHSTDSSASAKLVVGQRRRRSLGTEGRKAKAKDCFRELIWPRAC